MLKRWLVGIVLALLVGTGAVSAQDGGSTLQWWADTPGSAFNVTQQIGWPSYEITFYDILEYQTTGDPTPTCAASHSYSFWHSFIPVRTGKIAISALGSNYDTVTAVYKTSVQAANQVACFNANSSTGVWDGGQINVTAGTRYYVMLAAVGTGSTVDIDSALTVGYSSNNVRGRAFTIPGSGNYSIVQDRIELSETIDFMGPFPIINTVYYKFKPTVSGRYEISTQNSSYDTELLIEDGTFMAYNGDINANNWYSRLRVNLVAGTTYYIHVGQYSCGCTQDDNIVLNLRVRRL
jgi:hypothetical protein